MIHQWKLIALRDVPPTPWRNGGGHTQELFIDGEGQHWKSRISLATVDQDGDFSAYPGVHRSFAVIDGDGVKLRFPNGHEHLLTPKSAALSFDGNDAPHATLINGATRDLNWMVRVDGSRIDNPGLMLPVGDSQAVEPFALYTTKAGHLVTAVHQVTLQPHTLVVFQDAIPESAAFTGSGWWLHRLPNREAEGTSGDSALDADDDGNE